MEFRFATEDDCGLVLEFVKDLAVYEKMIEDVVATEEMYRDWLFERRVAEVLFVLEDGREVGFALFFHSFSTFLGRAGIYLEDLYVKPEHRGRGYGKGLLKRLARIAIERGCGRMEWCCLDWNTPSLEFYRSLGARTLDEWVEFRIDGDALAAFANDE